MNPTPLTVLSSTPAFQGRVFSVVIDRVRLANGVERDLQVVRHPASVILLPMPDPQSVVLVRQYRHPVAKWLWEVPAGTLEPGEDPDAAARRECEEETGYAPRYIERLAAFFPAPGYCDEEMIFYKLTGLARPETPAAPDEDECLEARTMSLTEARAMVRRGEIVDMKSALALGMV
jgi:ADP-ribose pyrophosphatase